MDQPTSQTPLQTMDENLEEDQDVIIRTIEDEIIDELGDYGPIALKICEQIAVTEKRVMTIAFEIDGGEIDTEAAGKRFYRAKNKSSSLSSLYTRCRESRADVMADNVVHAVDNVDCPHRARVMLEARKWACSRFNRGLYADDPKGVHATPSIQINVDATGAGMIQEIRRRLDRRAKKIEGAKGGVPSD